MRGMDVDVPANTGLGVKTALWSEQEQAKAT